MKTLTLTSPFTTGPNVLAAQQRLNGGNVFGTDYLIGPGAVVDGIFGPATSRSCIRAKYWLGYTPAEQTGIYGDLINNYLTGAKPLPADKKKRRAARIAAAQNPPNKPLGVRALEQLAPFLNTTEHPAGSNIHPISTWYGVQGPWCAMAVTYGMVNAGSTGFVRGSRYAYVPFMVIDAQAGANGLQVVKPVDVVPGDIVCYDWQGVGGSPYHFDHTEFVRSRIGVDGRFSTRGGNTSDDWAGSQSNGGGLYDRDDRNLARAAHLFIRASR